MGKHYKLLKLNDYKYTYVSMSTDFSRPDDYMSELEGELQAFEYKGKVVFDLLLSNGLKDRYFSAEFDGRRFVVSTFRTMTSICSEILGMSSAFYKDNYDLVSKNSILSKPQKFLVKKGMAGNRYATIESRYTGVQP
ncbi:type II toxin-antitoxin system RnlB family antitoxin [Vibrio parahaemolyticus]|uniref:type II toxin-antitoxin system RnlB family antitoxin n=1 Tax=Vibrio parahaemolyticus TaxID=670 RepID=UPI001FADAAD8|nr:type II toxin-antitoxin system RnlB family antitoxin [Vibrio parahaemolyticus]MCI9702170.1 type II toxin-antitoxin system RnlB family antitoxin [Vibrio parahaemolyticus]